MITLLAELQQQLPSILAPLNTFRAAYLFGSVLDSDKPRDVDLLLIYSQTDDPPATRTTYRLYRQLAECFDGRDPHITMMTAAELDDSGFLGEVKHIRVF